MTSKQSLELAAQCWCDDETKNIVMNTQLAVAFAKRLDKKDSLISDGLEREEGMAVAIDGLQSQLNKLTRQQKE